MATQDGIGNVLILEHIDDVLNMRVQVDGVVSQMVAFSEPGQCRRVDVVPCLTEKAGDTRGWTHTIYEETWNYGFPQEMAHFVDCVRNDREPLVTAADGRVVLEAVYAAYRSAGTGQRVSFPLQLSEAERAAPPVELWRAPAPA